MFLAPIFYPLEAIPEEYQVWILANPLTFIVIQSREVLIWGGLPDWYGLLLYLFFSLVVLWMGFWWFQVTRKGFADVL
jgi:lipopolysaccharide transport system permease protein